MKELQMKKDATLNALRKEISDLGRAVQWNINGLDIQNFPDDLIVSSLFEAPVAQIQVIGLSHRPVVVSLGERKACFVAPPDSNVLAIAKMAETAFVCPIHSELSFVGRSIDLRTRVSALSDDLQFVAVAETGRSTVEVVLVLPGRQSEQSQRLSCDWRCTAGEVVSKVDAQKLPAPPEYCSVFAGGVELAGDEPIVGRSELRVAVSGHAVVRVCVSGQPCAIYASGTPALCDVLSRVVGTSLGVELLFALGRSVKKLGRESAFDEVLKLSKSGKLCAGFMAVPLNVSLGSGSSW